MADEDVIRKLRELTGVGSIRGPVRRQRKSDKAYYKEMWEWTVTRSPESYALMIALWPHMFSRRRKQIRVAVEKWVKAGITPKPVHDSCVLCGLPARGRRLCSRHYQQWRLRGLHAEIAEANVTAACRRQIHCTARG